MNKYQEALGFIKIVTYDGVGITKELDILQELIDKSTPTKPTYKQVNNNLRPYCSKCGLRLKKTWSVCPRCGCAINWGIKNE